MSIRQVIPAALILLTLVASPAPARTDQPDPVTAAEFLERGNESFTKGELDAAIKDYNEAIKIDPKYADAYVARGCARWGKGEHDKSVADFSEAIKLDPDNALAFYNRGNVRSHKGEYDQA